MLIYDTDMGDVADDAAMLEAGALAETIDNEAVEAHSPIANASMSA